MTKASGRPVYLLSGVTGQGVPELLRTLQNTIHGQRRDAVEDRHRDAVKDRRRDAVVDKRRNAVEDKRRDAAA